MRGAGEGMDVRQEVRRNSDKKRVGLGVDGI